MLRCKHAFGREGVLHSRNAAALRATHRPSPWVMCQALLLLVFATQSTLAAELSNGLSQPLTVRREILGVFDGREEQAASLTRIHQFAEMPLNHLGYVVTYWDINNGVPPRERIANIHAILTWFGRPQPNDFYAWAQALVSQGTRLIVLGEGGFVPDDQPRADFNRLFETIGFRVRGTFVDLTYSTHVFHRDRLIGFEQPLDPVLPGFPIVHAVADDITSHLVLQYRDADAAILSSVVLTGNRGGFAASGYLLNEEPHSHRTKWIIDPFAFFRAALGTASGPVPDVNTLSGRRIYFSHIDGDGWNNASLIDAYYDAHMLASEVVLHELVIPYPDLPVTVGVIGADVDPHYGHVQTSRRIARDLFRQPQVEVATHTYTHPYEWSFFKDYDRQAEKQLTGSRGAETTLGDRFRRLVRRLFPGPAKAQSEDKPSDTDPPRAYSEFAFDLDQETRGAVAIAAELAPANKPTALYLWSGNADPFEAAVAAVRRLGVRNMNGGDSRFDSDYPSLAYVAPIARPVGNERQVYAGNANDYIYMSDGRGRLHGYLYLPATLAATEDPLRLKPFNVYYHMYAGERAATLAAVRRHLDEARNAAVVPISASQFAAIAEGFFTTQIAALDGATWRIRNRGALQTVRFDEAADVTLDLGRSVGVLGRQRKGATLYVALDAAYDEAVVALAPIDAVPANAARPYLIDSRWQLSNLERHDCGFAVAAHGYGPGQMSWGGLRAGTYRVSVRAGTDKVLEASATTDDRGQLAMTIDASALQPLLIDVACAKPDGTR
jgi:polysaccharide biosynthesis protein PelA